MSKSSFYHGQVGEVYWKLYRSARNELVTIVCMQWFDEGDYEEDRFIVNSNDEVHTFETEEMAKEKLNEWFEPKEIDPEYRMNSKEFNNVRD